MSSCKQLLAELDRCLQRDRHFLRQQCRRLSKSREATLPENLLRRFEASRLAYDQRLAALPSPEYPEELPVSERRQDILQAIQKHQVVIVAGETGSGKTTQLPKICLEAGRGVAGLIGHTQPRRLAARSVASRIAEELKTNLGDVVGYKVRFSDRSRAESYIKLMTDGILLAETQGDRFLNQYDTLIIDEAHERSLNIDFLLGYLKQLLPKRPDLKLIITSATIDTARFAEHFNDAPVIEVSGRTYPVDMRYRPLQGEDKDEQDRDVQQGICDAVDELAREGLGDILIFLPGEREIRETAESLRKHHPPHTEILPLYARLSAAEQNRVFQTHKGRRIVLSTNVAETSLTVPGIRYVIDPGLVRMSRYSHRTKVQRLPIEKISQASANQRAGRCGRVGPGICIRLYSEEDFSLRAEFTEAEIRRSNLASVILQMKSLGLGDIEAFPFVEAPDSRMISDGYKLLQELGAVDAEQRLTQTGRQLAKIPVDPRVARMVLAAEKENCLSEILIIASALSVQEARERPHDKQQASDEKHRLFADKESDFLAYLKLWQVYHEQAKHLSNNQLRKWCREHFVSYLRMREWHDVYVQLKTLVKEYKWSLNEQEADYAQIHRALLSGLLGNIANRIESKEQDYTGARGIKLHIFPGSVLAKKKPKWLMAAELVETSRMFARTVAKIEPEWIEQIAADVCKRSYFDPHWEKKPAAVMAYERLTLYGLVIQPRRKIHYAKIKPQEARELFIRGALVAADFNCQAGFFKHNQNLLAEIEALEAKSRRRDVLVDDEVLYQFYDQHIPADVSDGRRFEKWRKDVESTQPRLLYLTREDLMQHAASDVTATQFPDTFQVAGMALALKYHFEPGAADDGVTVIVPLPALNLLEAAPFEWLVPGLLHEKLCQLLKSLPKSLRRNFVPVPNFADACLRVISPEQGNMFDVLQHQLKRMSGVSVNAQDWDLSKLSPHMRMNFRVVDEHGKLLLEGRELLALQQQLKGQAQQSFAAEPAWGEEREAMTEWDMAELPQLVEFERNGVQMRGYPAVHDQGDAVALRLYDTAAQAERETRDGLRRLVMLALPDKLKYLAKNLPNLKQSCLYYAPVGRCEELQQALVARVIDEAFFAGDVPRTDSEYQQCMERGKQNLLVVGNELALLLHEILAEYHNLNKRLKGRLSPAWLNAVADIRQQMQHLIYPEFIQRTPLVWLREYPRYIKAAQLRLDKLTGGLERDRLAMLQLQELWQAYEKRSAAQAKHQISDVELETYRWMLEELRVSLFAQGLKTKVSVSVKRLQEQLKRVK